jgi:hypothetical protein
MEVESLFDNLNDLKLDQSFADSVGVKKLLKTVPVRKPNRQDFTRVHPAPEFRLSPAALIELKEDRETYLVTPSMAATLPGEFQPATLFQPSRCRSHLACEIAGARWQGQLMA